MVSLATYNALYPNNRGRTFFKRCCCKGGRPADPPVEPAADPSATVAAVGSESFLKKWWDTVRSTCNYFRRPRREPASTDYASGSSESLERNVSPRGAIPSGANNL